MYIHTYIKYILRKANLYIYIYNENNHSHSNFNKTLMKLRNKNIK